MYKKHFKRPFDIICALAAITVFCWLYLAVAVLVRLQLGSPILFKQKRPGKNEHIFTLYKFRTMTNKKGPNGNLLPDDERLTKFGKFLRKTSLDELPEAWNILKGDMSVVGPRPQLVRDMVFMTPQQRKRHEVRPGLTGLAQINGRNCIEWENKLNYDIKYVDNITFWGDIKIILATIIKVIKTESISYEGMETAEDFGDYLFRTGKIDQKQYAAGQMAAQRLLSG